MKNLIRSVTHTDEETIEFIWYPNKIIKDLKIHTVYGFCLTSKNQIVLVRDEDEKRFTLPGGSAENEENAEEALIREFKEEAQFVPTNIELLGSLEVKVTNKSGEVTDHHQQVRFMCRIDDPGKFIPKKDGWETIERIFVEIHDLPKYLEWIAYPTGRVQYKEFLMRLDK